MLANFGTGVSLGVDRIVSAVSNILGDSNQKRHVNYSGVLAIEASIVARSWVKVLPVQQNLPSFLLLGLCKQALVGCEEP